MNLLIYAAVYLGSLHLSMEQILSVECPKIAENKYYSPIHLFNPLVLVK